MSADFERLVAELEDAARQLREDELEADAAADLVERLASLASALGAELDSEARAPIQGEPPGQETLL
ncbi:MAG: hypothetical protein NVSMB25_13380 [Thermoleophilaceae bacterium]